MSRGESVGGRLAALTALKDNLRSEKSLAILRCSLIDCSNLVVERAADTIAESEDRSFVGDLLEAYRRLLVDPLEADPGCLGKTAIAKALIALDFAESAFFRDGTEYQQREGLSKDTAAVLRGICLAGLIGAAPSLEVLNRSAVLLADPYAEARAGAARALGALSLPEGAALLRLKLLVGDRDFEVIGECCSALLKLDREGSVALVAAFLSSPSADVCVQAGLALGESRVPEALEPLRRAWELRRERQVRKSLLICISLLRSAESRAFLVSLIDKTRLAAAADAIEALKLHAADDELRRHVEAAVAATEDASLKRVFDREWGVS